MKKIELTKESLHKKYIEENLTIPQIAMFFQCSKTTIVRRLSKFNIKKEKSAVVSNIKKKKVRKYDYGLIRKLYIEDNEKAKDIAQKLGCKECNIRKIIKKEGWKKTREQKAYYIKKVDLNKEFVNKEYIDKNRSAEDIAKELGISVSRFYTLVSELGIKKPKKLQTLQCIKNTNNLNLIEDRAWLDEEYIGKNKRIEDISEEIGISKHLIRKSIANFSLEKTTDQRSYFLQKVSTLVKDRKWLEEEYINKNRRIEDIAECEGVSKWLVSQFISKFKLTKTREKKNELANKTRVEKGLLFSVEGVTARDIVDRYDISHSHACKILKEFDPKTAECIDNIFSTMKEDSMNSLEFRVSNMLNVDFYNKKNKTGYKPDFKINDNIYLNVDGLYWHSEKILKNNRHHFKMRKEYEDKGLRILQFREDEVRNKSDLIKSMVNACIGKSESIYARKCVIKKVAQRDADLFLEKNHIMGKYSAKHLGLYYLDELVFIMSYKNFKKGLKIERLCSKIDKRVLGGFSKVLKHIESVEKFDKVEYWVDLRYGTGKFLENLGFKFSHETLGWKWTDLKNTYNRRRVMANMDDRCLSEKEYAKELRLFKIYDAGQRLYVRNYV